MYQQAASFKALPVYFIFDDQSSISMVKSHRRPTYLIEALKSSVHSAVYERIAETYIYIYTGKECKQSLNNHLTS